MQIHRTLHATGMPLGLAIGNFDGVHIGHQAILRETVNNAHRLDAEAAALTFEPLPREFFARHNSGSVPPTRLSNLREKTLEISKAGIHHLFVCRFDHRFAGQSPQAFIDSLCTLQVKWLMVGEDFRFGAHRSGDIQMLIDAGRRYGFEVKAMPEVRCGNLRASSTAVREALAVGNLSLARQLLRRFFTISGRVVHGKKIGRTLGFPTANILLTPRLRTQIPPLSGIFAVRCQSVTRGLEGAAGKTEPIFNGVASFGTNPVVLSENRYFLEVFLFDFSGDLYGQRLEIAFIEKIRDEQKFTSLDALVSQMHDDTRRAKNILRTILHGKES